MLIFTFCRILFLLFNLEHFQSVGILDFLAGAWFDLIATCLLFYPLILIELFPNKNRDRKLLKRLIIIFTALPFVLGTFINLIDVEYFHHTASRSNYSLLTMLGFGNDLFQQLPSFLKDYWYILLFLLLFLFFSFWMLRKIYRKADDSDEHSVLKQGIIYIISHWAFYLHWTRGICFKNQLERQKQPNLHLPQTFNSF